LVDESSFKDVGRNPKHCYAIYKVRIKHEMPVLTDQNRAKFMLLALAECHPDSKLGKMIREIQYDKQFLAELETLTPLSTLERDNREMERKGWFMKEKEQPKVVQEIQQTLL